MWNSTSHRVPFIKNVSIFIGKPILLALLLSRLAHLGTLASSLLCLLAIPAYHAISIQSSVLRTKREAAQHGAVLAPEIHGALPGNLDVLEKMGKDLDEGYLGLPIEAVLDRIGKDTVNARVMWQDTIITRDPAVVNAVLSTQFTNFNKGIEIQHRNAGIFGGGIFNLNGNPWKFHRDRLRPLFARERFNDLTIFETYTEKAINVLRSNATTRAINVEDVYGRFTMDSAGEFLFSTQFNTLDHPLPLGRSLQTPSSTKEDHGATPLSTFTHAFEDIQMTSMTRFKRSTTLWPAYELITDIVKPYNDIIDPWIVPLVEKALKEKEVANSGTANVKNASLLEHLAQTSADVKDLRDELMNMLFAARDTTASLLTFLTYILSIHPEVCQCLRAEILEEFPSSGSKVTQDSVRNLKYLRACINETLRIFPPVTVNERTATHGCVVPPRKPGERPLYIGPGVHVIYSDIVMQRDPNLWTDPHEFKPERWLDNPSMETEAKFIPFSAGPRICIGKGYAHLQVSLFMVRLLQEFSSFELCQEQDAPEGSLPPDEWKKITTGRAAREKIRPVNGITITVKGGLWVKMTAASD